MVKNQATVLEVKYDENTQQLVYVMSPRAKNIHPYQGTRISGVEDFSASSKTGQAEEEQENELERKLRAEINSRARTMKADAYEITTQQFESDDEVLSQIEEEDEEDRTYSVSFAAIFYQKQK